VFVCCIALTSSFVSSDAPWATSTSKHATFPIAAALMRAVMPFECIGVSGETKVTIMMRMKIVIVMVMVMVMMMVIMVVMMVLVVLKLLYI
jgi:hypothetical protein